MSAPTPGPGDDRPREGYYPDPSIPGYVRYWNGAAWVPGTSRPAPTDGEPLPPPPGVTPASLVEETGPVFFDEEPLSAQSQAAGPETTGIDGAAADAALHGTRPEPATAWGADRAQQSGFGGDQDRRISWGAAQGGDPRAALPDGAPAAAGGAPGTGADAESGRAGGAFPGPAGRTPGTDGTMTIRAVSPRTDGPKQGPQSSAQAGPAPSGPQQIGAASGAPSAPANPQRPAAPGIGSGSAAGAPQPGARQAPAQGPPQAAPVAPQAATGGPRHTAAPQAAVSAPAQQGTPVPQQGGSGSPLTSGPGGGQPSWAQQVHRLAQTADDSESVAPWKPPVDDPFLAAVRAQAAARPAALGKRFVARLLDTLVLGAVTAAAAVPLTVRAVDHINGKIDEAKLSGRTVTVWLIDGTTAGYLGVVLAVLLLFGVVYEALPTARWGRTLGKKLCGLQVRDIEGHEPPPFGAALRRWLVYSIPGVLVIGVVGVLWCLFDRPWRQCWHDKAAGTFVAG
ncbi:RDD family protein [Streptomyces sp. NPDC002004]